jgi:mRNA-degrading endonuclease RelE of RelBE toxin-antitoxin system
MLPEGRRHLARLPEKVAHAALGFIHGPIAGDPHRVGKPLGDDLDGLCSARRADYRIVYRIDDEARTVTIYRIQHRSDVYRPR